MGAARCQSKDTKQQPIWVCQGLQILKLGLGLASIDDHGGHSKLVTERRIELLVSRLSIECFEPTKLLRNGAEKRSRTADLLHTGQALFQLSYFGLYSGADGRTRTCDELGVGQSI